MLEIWVAEVSVNCVKWSKNLNFGSKLELKNFELTKNFEQECLSALCRATSICLYLISCVYLAYCRSYGHLKIVKCIGMY